MITYGMGPATLAERMGMSLQEANKIIEDFYKGFSGVEKFTKESQEMASKLGYVTDIYGRRRHLDDAALPPFEVKSKVQSGFNPLLHVSKDYQNEEVQKKANEILLKLTKAKYKRDKDVVKALAEKEGFTVKDNGGFISRAQRQTLNARIQGTAATMTKSAMNLLDKDEELKRLGFRLLVTVHDEVFGECPIVNAEKAAERVGKVMVEAAKVKCNLVPWKCDGYAVARWYADEMTSQVKKDFEKMKDFEKICQKYPHIDRDVLKKMCNGTFDILKNDKI